MSRLPAVVLALLAAATVGAFFVVQHLKVTTPLIAAPSAPNPGVINPRDPRVCGGVDHGRTAVSFYLKHRADDVDVYVLDQQGAIVATLASGRHMPIGVRIPDGVFVWNGREAGGQIAPDGNYSFEVVLIHQGRTVVLSPTTGGPAFTAKVKTRPPRPVVTSVRPQLVPLRGSLHVAIRYAGTEGHAVMVELYRTDLPGPPRLVKTFLAGPSGAVWDGTIGGRPAPAGIYLVGLAVTDAACNTGRFPAGWPPRPGTTAHAGVTVRYLAAQPPLRPIAPGAAAVVLVDSRQQPYRWALRGAGAAAVVASGAGSSVTLRVPVPAGAPGLYELTVRSGTSRTTVPLVASGPAAPVLVVLPALTWQGLNPVDDTGDGLPATLAGGDAIRLVRPLVGGLPAGFGDEVALTDALAAEHRAFQLTTDLGLVTGIGPALRGHRAVILAGSERWVTAGLAGALRSFVRGGGRVLSLGLDSLRASVRVAAGEARDPTPLGATDVFGLRHGAFVARDSGLITQIADGLGIFTGTAGVFPGFSAYEPITGASGGARIVSSAGTSAATVSVAGARLGAGAVVEVGIPGFAGAIASNVGARDLFDAIWSLLAR